LIKPLFLPSPQAVWQQFLEYATGRANDQPLLSHLGASLGRVSAAFVLACLTAIPVGLAMGSSRWVRGLLDPPLEFYRPLPPLAYLPLIIIWCGINELPKVLLIYLSCFAPLALAARSGVRAATTEQMLAAASLGAIVGRSCAMWCGLLRCQKSWSACALPLGLVGPHWWLLRW
jgi:taurine transport system permease protein